MKKTKHILLIFVLVLSANFATNAQIKIFTGGSVTIGATTAPTVNAVMHQINGGKVAFTATTSAVTSAPLINGNNGYSSATAPDFTWLGDLQTGMFHPAANVVAFTANGVEVLRASDAVGQPQIMYSYSSSLSYIPDYSWYGDNNTGMFHQASDKIGFTTGGSERLRINDNGQLFSVSGPASASTPDFSWSGDSNTGIFNAGADLLAFATNGAERMRATNSGNFLVGTTTDNGNRVQITGGSNQSALLNTVSQTADYGYNQINQVNRYLTKAFSVYNSASGTNTETFYVNGNGDFWYRNGTSYSDKNLKENIDSLRGALDKVKQLKGVTYNLKASFVGNVEAGRKEIGLIAQDVESILPEVVRTNDNGLKGISYQNIIPLLIEAIKAQDKQINQLQNDVNNCCSKTGTTATQSRFMNNLGKNSGETNGDAYAGNSYVKQNVPNPFNRETNIEYFIEEKSAASSILIFDMNGRLLKTYKLNGSGQGNLNIVGNELQPGMYYYSLVVNNKEVGTKKMILTE